MAALPTAPLDSGFRETFAKPRRPAPDNPGFPRSRGKCPKDKGGAKGLRRPLPLWIPAFAGMTGVKVSRKPAVYGTERPSRGAGQVVN